MAKMLTLPKITALLVATAICATSGVAAENSATITLKLQSAANTDFEHEQISLFVDLIRKLTESRIKIDVFPSGAIVKAFQMPAAVYKGVLEAAFYIDRYPENRDTLRLLSATACGVTLTSRSVLLKPSLPGGEIIPDGKPLFRQGPSEKTLILFIIQMDRRNSFGPEVRKAVEEACKENVGRALKEIGDVKSPGWFIQQPE